MNTPYWSLPTPNIDALIKHKKGNQMTDKQVLREVKKLSNGKFGKPMVFEGDAQIVIQRLLKIHVLVSNHLTEQSDDR